MVQQAHTIALAMFQYSLDHDGSYPTGSSSTEALQQLIDGRYITDPSIFYIPLRGKIEATAGPLKSENVCWDVTDPVTMTSPDKLPLVFPTGFKVRYVPGGSAVPLLKPYPGYTESQPRTWVGEIAWLAASTSVSGIGVCYKSNYATYIELQMSNDGNYSIPNLVPKDFNAHGTAYRQLTPDGILR